MKMTITEKADAVKPIKPQLDDMPECKRTHSAYQAWINEFGEGFLMGATHLLHPCGCKVIGNGTLQNPIDIKACIMHSAAPELLEALELCADFIKRAHGGEGMTEDERWSLLEDALNEARAAIQKARGVK